MTACQASACFSRAFTSLWCPGIQYSSDSFLCRDHLFHGSLSVINSTLAVCLWVIRSKRVISGLDYSFGNKSFNGRSVRVKSFRRARLGCTWPSTLETLWSQRISSANLMLGNLLELLSTYWKDRYVFTRQANCFACRGAAITPNSAASINGASVESWRGI